TVCVFLSALADTSSKKAMKKHFKQLLEMLTPLITPEETYLHEIPSSD
ncbi:hypothetical protein CFSAN001674_22765, partial [Salmonella enterica subsp. enterica serovar Cerro str. CFSAN001674]